MAGFGQIVLKVPDQLSTFLCHMKQLVRKEKTGMRFKDKVSKVALRVSLIAMVVLSIILSAVIWGSDARFSRIEETSNQTRSEEHTSELQSRFDLVCRLLLEKKKHR